MPSTPLISVIMGSQSDWDTMHAGVDLLEHFHIAHETRIISAHRTPERLRDFALSAEQNGIQVIIAGAGGAAHLPGMVAAQTWIPVLGVPVQSKTLSGMDSLLSIVQMPAGIPVGTLAIGTAGAKNAALMAMAILALNDSDLCTALKNYRQNQTDAVDDHPHQAFLTKHSAEN